MAPRVVLIRHAQALHNVNNKYPSQYGPRQMLTISPQDYTIQDPFLSDLGVEQCKALEQSLRDRFDDLSLKPTEIAIIASPMRRTLQTAQLATSWLTKKGVKVVADANWQGSSLRLASRSPRCARPH